MRNECRLMGQIKLLVKGRGLAEGNTNLGGAQKERKKGFGDYKAGGGDAGKQRM